jgi:hypothetical protein
VHAATVAPLRASCLLQSGMTASSLPSLSCAESAGVGRLMLVLLAAAFSRNTGPLPLLRLLAKASAGLCERLAAVRFLDLRSMVGS